MAILLRTPADPAETNRRGGSRSDGGNRSEPDDIRRACCHWCRRSGFATYDRGGAKQVRPLTRAPW